MNIMSIIPIITVSSLIVSFQVRVQLGLPNHAWQDKQSAIAKTVDDLGDQPCVPAGLLISRTLMVMLLPPLLPAKIRALWSWRTMTADVLLALIPRGIFPQ